MQDAAAGVEARDEGHRDDADADDEADGWERVSLPLHITHETMASLYDPTVDAIVAQARAVMGEAANNRMPCNKVGSRTLTDYITMCVMVVQQCSC